MIQKDTFPKVENIAEWSAASYHSHCRLCSKRDIPTCLTEKGRLCVDCVVSELKKMAAKNNLTEWTSPQIIHVLGSSGNVRWRLLFLWRFKKVFEIVSEESPADVDALLASLVHNLEVVHQHYLSDAILQAAIEACVSLGKKILPSLFQACKSEPWQSYANIILACSSIAPEDERVQNLIQTAVYHLNPIVRKHMINIIAKHDFTWGKDMLKHLANDKNKEVSTLATKIISNLNMLSLKRMTISNGITEDELKRIESVIEHDYTIDTLKQIYKQYLKNLFRESPTPQKKSELISAMAIALANQDLLQKLLSSLPENIRSILSILVWEGGKHIIKKLEKKFGIHIADDDGYHRLTIHDAYMLFRVGGDYYSNKDSSLYLSDEIRKIIKKCLPLPEGYHLIPLDTINAPLAYTDNSMILRQLSLFAAYIKQGNINLNKNKTKAMKGSVKMMIKSCHIQEFYADKELECMKTQLIADFMVAAKIEGSTNPINSLKQLFDNFFQYKGLKNYQLRGLLSHIKGDAYNYSHFESHEKMVRLSFFNLLKEMSDCRWYCIKNVLKHCLYNDIYLDIVDRGVANRFLSYHENYIYGYRGVEISEELYTDAVIIPLIKVAMFLFAAFGLVDIAYNLPENPVLQEKERPYLSTFDGLQYVRLTKLGAYVLGLTEGYEIEGIEEQKANLILDEHRLLIHMEGEDILKRIALEKVGEKLSNSHYRVDCSSFLKECFSEKDIQQKVAYFKEYISSNPPQIWKDFLNGILRRINPLTIEANTIVCKLTPDRELISLIATDEILKKYILKAENYRILIEAAHVNKIKKRLGELGYFVGNM